MPIRAMSACWNKPRFGPCSRIRPVSEGGGNDCWLRKPRTWAWLAGVFILLVVGVAGLTGLLLRQQLAPLQVTPLLLENGARLQVEELQAGWFGTRTVLRLDWPLDRERQLVLRVANAIGHGPFPGTGWPEFDLRPAVLSDRLQLLGLTEQRGKQQQALPAQLSGNLRLSYLGHLQSGLQGTVAKLPLGVWQLALDDLQLALDASLDSLDLQLQAQQLELLQGGAPLLRLSGLEQQLRLDGDATTATLGLQAAASELALWDQPVGRLGQQLTADGVALPRWQRRSRVRPAPGPRRCRRQAGCRAVCWSSITRTAAAGCAWRRRRGFSRCG